MHVVATAGHVDHGKSTLVRAVTGMEPDRWAEERRRGMTIDLGYAWTTLGSGEVLGFVDVPGHQRFIGNMLAGLGPSPAVLFVVAADGGWERQSGEHLAAVDALGLQHGLLAVTRSDLADPKPARKEALARLAASSLGEVPYVTVSGVTGAGLPDLREALAGLVGRLPAPTVDGPVRLWVDRAFTVRGAGTVVTGTLGAGTLRVGDELVLRGRPVRVRGLQSLGEPRAQVAAVARVAVNLRGVDLAEVARGDTLRTPDAYRESCVLDVRVSAVDLPGELVLHVGSTAVAVRVRPLGGDVVRLTLHRPLPLRAGDRALLRDPGRQLVTAGVQVLDADPPPLRRRGAAVARAEALGDQVPDLVAEVSRRGAVRRSELASLGVTGDAGGLLEHGDWLVTPQLWQGWSTALAAVVDQADVLSGGVPTETARQAAGVPDLQVLAAVARGLGLVQEQGRWRRPGAFSLGPAEAAVVALEARLTADPMDAPEGAELLAAGLGARELAAAERAGRVVRVGDVVLLPDGPARAMRVIAGLSQPFTLSQARQALGTTRRVAVPLLEHLDRRGWTQRLDGQLRQVRR